MIDSVALPLLLVFPIGLPATAGPARAELVGLAEIVQAPASEIAGKLKAATAVVCVRSSGPTQQTWPAHAGLATELTAALRRAGVEAFPASADVRLETLSSLTTPFTTSDAKLAAAVETRYLVGGTLQTSGTPVLRVVIWQLDPASIVWTKDYPVRAESLDLQANLPDFNRRVVAYCQANLDRAVGTGECLDLAAAALQAAGTKRRGIYTWGRELAAQEPVIPGDILQMELVEMRAPGFTRNYAHHTAVVEQVRPDALVVLHQNVAPKGRIVQRDTWPRNALKSGQIVAYRPTSGDSPLPPVSPKRRTPATIVRRGSAIDLLRTADPRLDAVRGIWFIQENTLRMNRDDYARLQVPVAPPERYTLRLRVQRLVGNDQFAVGLVVGGRQTMCCFDAYGATVSGLQLVDGRKVRDSPLAHRGQILLRDATAEIVLRVTPDSVRGDVDGKTIVDWSGDPQRLSVDLPYAVPNEQWLFLAAWNSHFAISEFTLEDNSDRKP